MATITRRGVVAAPTAVRSRAGQAESTRKESQDLARSMGMWSLLASAILLGLSMMAFVLVGPWTGMVAYAADPSPWKLIIWVLFFLLTVFFVLAVASVHAVTPERWKLFSLVAYRFALAYAANCATNCLLQLTFVQQRGLSGDLAGLEPWASASPNSALFATDQLAFFLQGLATLFLAPLLGGSRLANIIKWQLVANAVFTAVGVVATALGSYAGPNGQLLYAASVLPGASTWRSPSGSWRWRSSGGLCRASRRQGP